MTFQASGNWPSAFLIVTVIGRTARYKRGKPLTNVQFRTSRLHTDKYHCCSGGDVSDVGDSGDSDDVGGGSDFRLNGDGCGGVSGGDSCGVSGDSSVGGGIGCGGGGALSGQ